MTAATSLESLKDLGSFEVSVEGPGRPSALAQVACGYFDWVYGERGASGWVSFKLGFRSSQPVSLVTPRGSLTVSPNRLRLYLEPSFSQTFDSAGLASAPPRLQQMLKEEPLPVTVAEFCLTPDRRYYAQVELESYFLPPEPGSDQPTRRQNAVLALSDAPFVDGKPQRPLVPSNLGFSY